jgi:N-acetylmuramoyl-L-alanine amidase
MMMNDNPVENPTPTPMPLPRRVNTPRPNNRQPVRVNMWSIIQTILLVALLSASVFTMWTPNNLFSNQALDNMLVVMQSNATPTATMVLTTATPSPKPRIGLVSGHWGNDSGAVCDDGVTEKDVNLRIATLVKQYLTEAGYTVDLLQEFDNRLNQYEGLAVISIHNDSCKFIDNDKTGFKVAAASSDIHPEKVNRLLTCMVQRYASITGMRYHPNTITEDMTSYHAFREINSNTPAAIIETGFLNLDKQILTQKPDVVAKGVTAGLICYAQNESISTQTAPTAPPPQAAPKEPTRTRIP